LKEIFNYVVELSFVVCTMFHI